MVVGLCAYTRWFLVPVSVFHGVCSLPLSLPLLVLLSLVGVGLVVGVGWRFISSQELVDAGFSEGDEVTITIKNSAMAPYSSYTGWGKLLKRAQGVPTIVLTFDDGGSGPWDQLDYTKDKDIKGTIFYPWDYEGLDSKLTVSQLTELRKFFSDIDWKE